MLRELKRQIKSALACSDALSHTIVRCAIPVSVTRALPWLKAQRHATPVYWASRDGSSEIAGLGEADVISAAAPASLEQLASDIRPALSRCPSGVRYYGGMRFDLTTPSYHAWRTFGAYRFVLPRLELRIDSTGSELYCNLIPARDTHQVDKILRLVDGLAESQQEGTSPVPIPLSRRDLPDPAGWEKMVKPALQALNGYDLGKIVLAREATLSFPGPLNAYDVLEQLAEENPNCYHYLFQPPGGVTLMGTSPERLFAQCGRVIESEAVAGTRPRGSSADHDAQLQQELIASDKERREHESVRVCLQELLQPLVETLELDPEPSELELTHWRHLYSHLHARLRSGVSNLDVLLALHPGPAIAGYPRKVALDAIRKHEPIDRGWFTGPVGWLGPDSADFAVVIRSGLMSEHLLRLYSGAGIVLGSVVQAEWEELDHKIRSFSNLISRQGQ